MTTLNASKIYTIIIDLNSIDWDNPTPAQWEHQIQYHGGSGRSFKFRKCPDLVCQCFYSDDDGGNDTINFYESWKYYCSLGFACVLTTVEEKEESEEIIDYRFVGVEHPFRQIYGF